MRSFYRTVYFLSCLFLISACSLPEVDKPKVPEFKSGLPDDAQKMLDLFVVCHKSESEITIPESANQNKMTVTDEIETKQIETTDCDGKVDSHVGPVRNLTQTLDINPPEKINDKVTFITVENDRTCAIHEFDTKSDLNTPEDPKGSSIAYLISEADFTGQMKLNISDSISKFNLYINVQDGKNVLKITYHGKCQEYRDPSEDPDMKEEWYRCKKSETLATKEILLQVDVKRPKVDGIEHRNSCILKK